MEEERGEEEKERRNMGLEKKEFVDSILANGGFLCREIGKCKTLITLFYLFNI